MIRQILDAAAAALVWALAAVSPASAAGPDAATLLRRADLVRNPFLGTALDLELTVVSRASEEVLRRSRFTMLTRRGDRTLLLMFQDDPANPGALLIAEDTYWLLLPHVDRPVELALRHVVAGDLSHAGFLRVNLRLRYTPRIDGEETLGGVPCWRLELLPKSEPALFGRVRYWVGREGFLPIRIEFYSPSGELLKTARFTRYQDTGMGPRPARIEIEDGRRPDEGATLALGPPIGVPTSGLAFDLDDLAALRDAARSAAAPASGHDLVKALVASARAAGGARRRR